MPSQKAQQGLDHGPGKKCFLCWTEIKNTKSSLNSENDNNNAQDSENSFILIHILQVPRVETYLDRVNAHGQHISYCADCSGKINHIRGILEDLENLEKILLDEKYEIELQFRRQFPTDDEKETNGFGDIGQENSTPSVVRGIRNDIVSDLRSTAILSTLETLKKKRLNGKIPQKSADSIIRVMKSVNIPKVQQYQQQTPISTKNNDTNQNHQTGTSGNHNIRTRSSSVTGSKSVNKKSQVSGSQSHENSKLRTMTPRSPIVNSSTETVNFYEDQVADDYPNMMEMEENNDDNAQDLDNLDHNPISSMMEQTFEEGFQPLQISTSTFPSSLFIEEVFPEPVSSLKLEGQGPLQDQQDPLADYSHSQDYFESLDSDQNPLLLFCDECGESFDTSEELQEHVTQQHADFKISNPIPTPRGNLAAIRKTQLRNRKKIVSHSRRARVGAPPAANGNVQKRKKGQGSMPCSECGKSFSSPRNLICHMRYIHLGQFTHRCPICQQGCRGAADLRTHLESHSTDRNYSCPICSNGFKQKHNLRVHIRSFHPEHADTLAPQITAMKVKT